MFSVFVRRKVSFDKNVKIFERASGIGVLDCSKLTINPKNDIKS